MSERTTYSDERANDIITGLEHILYNARALKTLNEAQQDLADVFVRNLSGRMCDYIQSTPFVAGVDLGYVVLQTTDGLRSAYGYPGDELNPPGPSSASANLLEGVRNLVVGYLVELTGVSREEFDPIKPQQHPIVWR